MVSVGSLDLSSSQALVNRLGDSYLHLVDNEALQHITLNTKNGVTRARCCKAENQYNRAGITLECIAQELAAARLTLPHTPADTLALVRTVANGESGSAFAARFLLAGIGKSTPELQVRPGDDQLVNRIQQNPTVLLSDPEAQDAVARWLYAKHYGKHDSTEKAAGLLEMATKGKHGGQAKYEDYAVKPLQQAYADAKVYGTGLNRCLRKLRTVEQMRRFFPDYEHFADHIVPLKDFLKKEHRLPTAVQFADKIVCAFTGIRRSSLRNLLKS